VTAIFNDIVSIRPVALRAAPAPCVSLFEFLDCLGYLALAVYSRDGAALPTVVTVHPAALAPC
jgi:hypothetical protein